MTRLLLYRLPHFALLGLFSWLFLYSAWLCDDSYISFRVLQNWDQGEGLSWNPGQRVQAFSHPSWMLLLYLAWKLHGNLFIAAIGLSFALSFGSLCFLVPKQRNGFKTGIILLPIALLLFSKGFIDYSSSGLENPLSFFLFGLLCWHTIIKKRPFSSAIYLLIAFAVLNRLDTILLILPLLLKQWIHKPAENVKMALPGLGVMFLWFAF
ncbi:MAG: hypothetical protein VX278_23615, partial [Myxococcota bacterium]|nr:hypothetical protein [Myxococcota bacterium]